jgi:serine/threonine-protein kinase
VLGRYELLLPIAQGGMATVWAARQKGSRGFQKTVAVKTMLPNLSDDPQFEQMFLDEASLAARIHHPNVAEILDLGEQDEVLYIVMEWVDGEALSVVAKTAKKNDTVLPQRIVLRIIGQACAGLHAAHELRDDADQLSNLVHRDVSPQNILVTYDGVVKLVDFGVAKAIGRAGGETTAGQLKGKVPYMSPEQAKGGQVDRRTDVFAMGIVLYKLTVGVHPFLGDNDLVTMRNIISRPVLSPRVKNPNFSPELEAVLMKCLQKDPDKRYQTIADLDRAIDRVLAITGASVVDDDVGSFVRTILGDRGQKRRAALRDAVRSADERAAGRASPPTVHEPVSDLMITKLASGVKEEMLPERLSDLGPTPPPLPVSALGVVHDASRVFEGIESRRPRPGMVVALTASVVTMLGLAFVLLRSNVGRSSTPETAATSQAPVNEAPRPSAAATAALPTTSEPPATVSVEDLPVDEKPAEPVAPAPGKRRPNGPPAAAPKPAAQGAPASTSTSAPKPATTTKLPTVLNPGF